MLNDAFSGRWQLNRPIFSEYWVFIQYQLIGIRFAVTTLEASWEDGSC
jgi:hypothetical protein